MDLTGLLAFNVTTSIATLVLITLGLGVIYGMMGIINLAHGELMMLGAYTTVTATDAGVNIWVAMLVLPPLVVGLVGLVLERTVIRFLYGRMMDTMLATWGISLALIGLITTVYGNNIRGVSSPVGSFSIGRYGASLFSLVIIATALGSLVALLVLFRATKFGLILRATMQNPRMAACLGVSPATIYMATFALGSAFAGLAGGVLAPISGISPSMGAAYIARAFITVLGGGPAIVTGTALASTLFGFIDEVVSFKTSPVIGDVALLVTAVILIRLLPQGITARFLRRSPVMTALSALNRSKAKRVFGFVATLAAAFVVMFAAPYLFDDYGLLQLTIFAAMAIFALSQGFVWGYAGIMSFGQAAFLGIGGYAYAVAAISFGGSVLPVAIAIVIPMLFAAVLGYFMFYGRISEAYIGVITLTVSVILFQLINATSGSQYRIGDVELGGFNGIPAVPAFNLPGTGDALDQTGMWYAGISGVIFVYVLLRAILASRFGRIILAIRENETRAQLLGYDTRLYKVLAFVVAAGIAGFGGALYAAWGGFISPTVFGLTMSAQVIIFVLVGGLGTLIGPILGATLIQWLINVAGTQNVLDANLGLGLVLIAFVLLVPQGIVPVAGAVMERLIAIVTARRFSRAALSASKHGLVGKTQQ